MTHCDINKIDNIYDLKTCVDQEYAEAIGLTDSMDDSQKKRYLRQLYALLSVAKASADAEMKEKKSCK